MDFIFIATIGYVVGSVPWGLVLCYISGKEDPRLSGSGNIGATNILRTAGKTLALCTLILDASKGALVVYLTALFLEGPYDPMISGVMTVVGHNFPIWLKFKGGKGVATTLGVYIALFPFVGLIACGIWGIVFLIFRYSFLSALVAFFSVPFIVLFIPYSYESNEQSFFICLSVFLSMLSLFRHKANLRRLIKGQENKINTLF
ncbi:MAG: glycerol-3-phosphate 1-O-acyltransferase PlsY [Pseudomonadota bacterium]